MLTFAAHVLALVNLRATPTYCAVHLAMPPVPIAGWPVLLVLRSVRPWEFASQPVEVRGSTLRTTPPG